MEREYVQGEKGIRDTQNIPAGWSEGGVIHKNREPEKDLRVGYI